MRVPQPPALRFFALAALCALAFPSVARADKKEFLALTQQIATLQGQVAEADQARLDAQKDLKRIMDILVEQSALLKKLQQDMKIQDERAMVAIKDQQERLSEISDRLRTSTAAAMSQPPGSGAPGLSGAPGATQTPAAAGPAIPPRDL